MDKPKNKVTVEIFGETYALKGEGDPERIMEIAAFLDSRMHKASRGDSRMPPARVAVLAALNLADDYLRLENDYKQIIQLLKKGK